MTAPDRPPFLIREAGASDIAHVSRWMPEALRGTPAARLLIAADAATMAEVGVAALRVFADHVGRFMIFVEPTSRRRGCGTALLDAVRDSALRAGVTSLLTVQSYEVTANDENSAAARAFFQARGLIAAQEIRRLRADLNSALSVLEPLYERLLKRMANRPVPDLVQSAQVDPNTLAAFAVRHVGGIPEEVVGRLRGHGASPYSPTLSWVALVDNRVVGALLSVPQKDNVFLVETRVVDAGLRGSGLNLALMYRAAAAGVAAGIKTIEFEHDTHESDTTKLVRRLGAAQVGCRQCWGVSLTPSTSASMPEATQQNALERLRAPEEQGNQRSLRAAHTPNFPALLQQLGASLLITTYQSGKLVLVRDEGDHLNAHLRAFQAPMGLALDGDRLAIGTQLQVYEFVNVPAVAGRLEPPGRHDACFLPLSSHFTGNIHNQEMAWGAGGELWIVNTRFSCLCTLDRTASFAPRWKPSFISALEPSDRCHLNGIGMAAGKPKYVTALGESDSMGGWRENKVRGGIVIDVESGAVLARGLSLPHSPRWHGDRLWVCESGTGTLGFIRPGRRDGQRRRRESSVSNR